MDVSLNFWNTLKWQLKYLASGILKTIVLPPWFWDLLSLL